MSHRIAIVDSHELVDPLPDDFDTALAVVKDHLEYLEAHLTRATMAAD